MKYNIGDKFMATLYRKRCEIEITAITCTDDYWVSTPFGEELWDQRDFEETDATPLNND